MSDHKDQGATDIVRVCGRYSHNDTQNTQKIFLTKSAETVTRVRTPGPAWTFNGLNIKKWAGMV